MYRTSRASSQKLLLVYPRRRRSRASLCFQPAAPPGAAYSCAAPRTLSAASRSFSFSHGLFPSCHELRLLDHSPLLLLRPHPARELDGARRGASLLLSGMFRSTLQPCRSLSGRCDESNDVDEKQSKSKQGKARSRKIHAVDSSASSPSSSSSSPPDSRESVKKDPGEEEESRVCDEESVGDTPPPHPPPAPEKERKKGNAKVNPLKTKFKKMLVGWEKIDVTFENFPYYLNEHTKNLLVEAGAAQLRHPKQRKYGKSLRTSSRLVLLTGSPGTEIYQEKLVRALAHSLRTSLLVLDTDDLTAQHYKQDQDIQSDSGEETGGRTVEEGELWDLSSADDEQRSADEDSHKKKIIPAAKIVETFGHIVGLQDRASRPNVSTNEEKDEQDDDDEDSEEEPHSEVVKIVAGDRVRFIGRKDSKGMKKRTNIRVGQQGLVAFISETFPEKVGVKFEGNCNKKTAATGKKSEGTVSICHVSELERVESKFLEREPWMTSIEAFSELVTPSGGMIVYFPDLQKWMAKAVPRDERNLFLHTLADFLESSKGPIIFIAGRRKEVTSANNTNSGQFNPLKNLLSSMRGVSFRRVKVQLKGGEVDMKGTEEVFDIFKNVVPILPPQEPDEFRLWREQLDRDKRTIQSRCNLREIEKVLVENAMSCAEAMEVDTSDLILTEKQAQKIVGWARNISLNASVVQQKGKTLSISKESLQLAVSRFRALEKTSTDKGNDIKALAENDYETELATSVVRAKDIGIRFDQIGALDDVKTTLKELIILPLKRPELFSKGNLRKPCKGVLLFGPPGTGKTLLAKAVATEAGANFMSINASNINSKWFGEAEKLAKSIFTLARKLQPTIIFIDEVDGILRARGDSSEHEASRRVRNELMAAWDGLQSRETERILVLATTNRPFDLDDAVVRRLPRRIFIDLPDLQNRDKILRILLAEEELTEGFDYKELAAQTESFSGSDLKNLCVAAAYRPIQEYLEAENQHSIHGSVDNLPKDREVSLRPLCLEDFIEAKKKVGTSVAYDASSMVQMRHWNEQYGEGGSRAKSIFGFIK